MPVVTMILLPLVITATAYGVIALPGHIRRWRDRYSPDYLFELGLNDHAWLEDAHNKLDGAHRRAQAGSWQRKNYIYLFFPLMLAIMFLAFVMDGVEQALAKAVQPAPVDAFYAEWRTGAAFILFGGLAFLGTAALLYAIALRRRDLSDHLAISTDIYGADGAGVTERLKARTVRDYRAGRIGRGGPFDVHAWLAGRNRHYLKCCLLWLIPFVALAAWIGRANHKAIFAATPEAVVVAASWTDGKPVEIGLGDIEQVSVRCWMVDGKASAHYRLSARDRRLGTTPIDTDTIYGLAAYAQAFRKAGTQVVAQPGHRLANTDATYSKACVQFLVEAFGEDALEIIFADRLL